MGLAHNQTQRLLRAENTRATVKSAEANSQISIICSVSYQWPRNYEKIKMCFVSN